MKAGPFTVEIIRLGRSSQSPIIYEVLDYSCALTDSRGDLIAQANGVPGFLGTLTFAVKAVLEKFSPETLRPGDTIITNGPYSGGGALRTAKNRVKEIAGKYRADIFVQVLDEILDHGEALGRKALKKLPKGTFLIEDRMDDTV